MIEIIESMSSSVALESVSPVGHTLTFPDASSISCLKDLSLSILVSCVFVRIFFDKGLDIVCSKTFPSVLFTRCTDSSVEECSAIIVCPFAFSSLGILLKL